jgi:hypothetical protein
MMENSGVVKESRRRSSKQAGPELVCLRRLRVSEAQANVQGFLKGINRFFFASLGQESLAEDMTCFTRSPQEPAIRRQGTIPGWPRTWPQAMQIGICFKAMGLGLL